LPTIKIKLRLTDAQYADINQICRLRKLIIDGGLVDVQKYSAELIDARMAGFRSLIWQLRQMITDAGEDFEKFAVKLISADISEFRSLRIGKNFLLPQREYPPPLEGLSTKRKQRRARDLSPAATQKLLFLADTEKLNSRQLAQRFGVSAMTVGRILQRRESNAIRVPTAPRPKHGQRWGDTGGGASA